MPIDSFGLLPVILPKPPLFSRMLIQALPKMHHKISHKHSSFKMQSVGSYFQPPKRKYRVLIVTMGLITLVGAGLIVRNVLWPRPPHVALSKPLLSPRELKLPASTVDATPSALPSLIPSLIPTPSPTPSGVKYPGQTAAVPIVMYHYVRADPGAKDPVGRDLSVTPQDFADEMNYLDAKGYTTLTLGDLEKVRERKALLPAKPVVLTFDDGYLDFYTAAWPVLQQHHFHATIFIITGFVGRPQYLSWSMIQELDASGLIEMGGHTIHHADLAVVSDKQSASEINGCKTTLEAKLGHSISSFAYPSGRYTKREIDELAKAGFVMAVTTKQGFAYANSASFELPRVRIHGLNGLSQLKLKL